MADWKYYRIRDSAKLGVAMNIWPDGRANFWQALEYGPLKAKRMSDVHYSLAVHNKDGVHCGNAHIPSSTFNALFEEVPDLPAPIKCNRCGRSVRMSREPDDGTTTCEECTTPDGADWDDAPVEVWKNVSHAAEHGPPGPATFARALLELQKRDLVRYTQMNKLEDAMGIDPAGMEQDNMEALRCEVSDLQRVDLPAIDDRLARLEGVVEGFDLRFKALEAKIDHIAVTDG